MVTSVSAIGWMLVTTTRPRLAVRPRMDSIIAPDPTPMAQMTLSHMCPQVSCSIEREGLVDGGGHVGRPEGGGQRPLQLDRVDGEDRLGAGEAGTLDAPRRRCPRCR